jgi:hypothetical protein
MNDPLVLAPVSRTSISLAPSHPGPRFALYGFGATALLAMGFLTAGLPLISMCMLAVAAVSSLAIGGAVTAAADPRDDAQTRWVPHEAIVASEAHAGYCAVLLGFADLERALADAPRLRKSLASVIERCRAAVALSGRIALLANPLQRYLDTHETVAIQMALDRLRARAEVASDDATVAALGHAACARMRQLVVLEQIAAQRDRICARLALVHAALEAFAATIVKLQSLDDEQIVLAGESVTDQLAEIGGDLEILESALGPALDPALDPALGAELGPDLGAELRAGQIFGSPLRSELG